LRKILRAALRIREAVHLKPTAIDSRRMIIRVEQDKEQKIGLKTASRKSALRGGPRRDGGNGSMTHSFSPNPAGSFDQALRARLT
jgi:hypothetical protein